MQTQSKPTRSLAASKISTENHPHLLDWAGTGFNETLCGGGVGVCACFLACETPDL